MIYNIFRTVKTTEINTKERNNMTKILKASFAVLMTALIMLFSTASVFAAEKLNVNGADTKKGDKITYTLNLSECSENIEGLQIYVVYDSKSLKIQDESLAFPKLGGVVSNTEIENLIAFNWTDVKNTADFSKKAELMKVDFEVVGSGTADVTYFVSEMYGHDLTYLKSFTFTNDISVNGKKVVKDAAAIVNNQADIINEYQGSFTNYADGKGEKNGSGKNHVAIIGETKSPDVQNATEVTKDSGSDTTTIIIILVIAAIIIAIIIVAVIGRHYNKKNPDNENTKE